MWKGESHVTGHSRFWRQIEQSGGPHQAKQDALRVSRASGRRYTVAMSKSGQKIIEKIAALPEAERESVEQGVLEYIDWITDLRTKIADGEADVAAGRVKPARDVLKRLLAKYAAP